MIEQWSWLGDHLALDLANTVRRRGLRYTELLREPADLATWHDRERDRLTAPDQVDHAYLERFLVLRNHALALLRALAEERPLPRDSRHAINHILTTEPTVRLIDDDPGTFTPCFIGDPDRAIEAELATAVASVLTEPGTAGRVGLCDAPGCGQLFLRDRRNQVWCGPHCGARARSER